MSSALPQIDVCAFHPHTLHLHRAFLEYRRAVSTEQQCITVQVELKASLTQCAVGGFENGPSFPKPHGATHLPGVVFWHINHLQRLK